MRRNPVGPLNNPDYFVDYVLNELRKFSSRLSDHFSDLPVEHEQGDSQKDRKTATFKKPFDVLICEMIPIAEELGLPVTARKDGNGVSDFVALVAESLRAYSEAHTNNDREAMAAHYSAQYEEAGLDTETITQLEEIWRQSYEFGRKTLQKHSHTDAAITEAVRRALKRRNS